MDEILENKGLSGFVSYSVGVVENIKNSLITGKYNLVIALEAYLIIMLYILRNKNNWSW